MALVPESARGQGPTGADGIVRPLALGLETLKVVGTAELIALPSGAVLALLLTRTDLWGRRVMLGLAVLALFVPMPLHALAWLGALGNVGRIQAIGSRPLLVGWLGAVIAGLSGRVGIALADAGRPGADRLSGSAGATLAVGPLAAAAGPPGCGDGGKPVRPANSRSGLARRQGRRFGHAGNSTALVSFRPGRNASGKSPLHSRKACSGRASARLSRSSWPGHWRGRPGGQAPGGGWLPIRSPWP